jgi:hypothetical protein
LPTVSFNWDVSRASDCVDYSTWPVAKPVSTAASVTDTMFDETSCVPEAACWTLRAISPVAMLCYSTAVEIASDIWSIRTELAKRPSSIKQGSFRPSYALSGWVPRSRSRRRQVGFYVRYVFLAEDSGAGAAFEGGATRHGDDYQAQ